jgi:hypothetical protein
VGYKQVNRSITLSVMTAFSSAVASASMVMKDFRMPVSPLEEVVALAMARGYREPSGPHCRTVVAGVL